MSLFSKRKFQKIIGRFFLFAKSQADAYLKHKRNQDLLTKAVIGASTNVSTECDIVNVSRQPDKLTIGDNCWIRGDVWMLNSTGSILIGNNTFIGTGTKIWCTKKIIIGSRVLIAHNVNIHDNNSHSLDMDKRHKDYIQMMQEGKVIQDSDFNAEAIVIEDDAWIGFNAIILKGVKIGKGAIIGAGTVITKDIPDYAVAVGNPCRIINYVKPRT